MGYYMRYFIPQTAQPTTLTAIHEALKTIDPLYAIQIDSTDPSFGELFFGERNLGEIEINHKDDEIFEEEIEDFLELLTYHTDAKKEGVIQTIQATGHMVAVSAVWENGNADDADFVHDHLDPLWDWLDTQYDGMLHCDADGFYNGQTLILEMNVRI
ncbi:MAG TPA: hypothetical protein PLZ51_04935 [Aggregatilineales bacterium]|nr:hypothetical protein [Aggregatilineales bacterium]